MAKLVEMDLGNGRLVLVETNDEVSVPRSAMPWGRDRDAKVGFGAVTGLLRGFTDRSVAALRDVNADVTKVTLEFGVSLGGEVGLPFVTKGREASALFVTVECDLSGHQRRAASAGPSEEPSEAPGGD